MPTKKKRERDIRPAVRAVIKELKRALKKFGRKHSAHEAYAVLLEEVLELQYEVFRKEKKRDYAKMEAEACQVAVAAIGFMMDVCGDD